MKLHGAPRRGWLVGVLGMEGTHQRRCHLSWQRRANEHSVISLSDHWITVSLRKLLNEKAPLYRSFRMKVSCVVP